MWRIKSLNAHLVSYLSVLIVLSLVRGNEGNHVVDKRQVGVLARSGALPQGKRSVEALARNGELPVARNDKRDNNENYVLDQFIRELGTAEGLSRLRLQALAERLADDDYEDVAKRSLASLARNSELPRKRFVNYRSGYLVRPSQETKNEETDLLDPDEFLGKGGVDVLTVNGGFNAADDSLASFAKHGYEDSGEEVSYFDDEYDDFEKDIGDKRHVGAARNFFSDGKTTVGDYRDRENGRGKKNLASFKNFLSAPGKRSVGSALNFGKRNVGAARNFLLSGKRNIGAFRNFLSNKRNVGAARNFLLGEGKRGVGAAKDFMSKRNVGAAKDFLNGKRNLASFARDGGFTTLKYPNFKDYDWDDFIDFDDFHEEEEKRNVGAFKNFGKRSAPDEDLKSKPLTVPRKDDKESNKTRTKRDAYLEGSGDEYPMPMMQASRESDYGEVEPLSFELDKRFLGSVASWPREQDSVAVAKRHIGALARLGWLPSFRTARYSRSGRAITSRSVSPFRPNPSIGTCPSENSYHVWSPPSSVEAKVAIGRPKGIFRRVGRSLDSVLSESEKNYR